MADNSKPVGFSFGTPAAKPAGSGFSFGQSTPAAPPGSGTVPLSTFNLTAAPISQGTGFSFGNSATNVPPKTTASSMTFGQAAASNTNNQPSFGFGSVKPAATVIPPTMTTSGFGGSGEQNKAPPAFGTVSSTVAQNAPSLQSTTAPPAVAPSRALPTFSSSADAPGTTSSVASAFVTPGTAAETSTPAVTSTVAPNPLFNLSTTTTTTQSTPTLAKTANNLFNFCQLEEHINKWTLELEEQEKMFSNQATQINAWDRVLIENSDKIVGLNEAFKKVKIEQKALEQELEYIAAQHVELDECIRPLEKEMSKSQQVDPERQQTYSLADNLDTQLKQMGEDLKEVIEHLNEANKDKDPNDPIVQIGKILNAHMSSLQWIENSTSHITSKLENITKLHEALRHDNERSFRVNI